MGTRKGESDSTSCVCLQGVVVSVWLSDKARDIGFVFEGEGEEGGQAGREKSRAEG